MQRTVLIGAAALLSAGCSMCEPSEGPTPKASATAATTASAPERPRVDETPAPPQRRSLSPRGQIDLDALGKARNQALEALKAKDGGAAALAELEAPGIVVAVKAAELGGETNRWARHALRVADVFGGKAAEQARELGAKLGKVPEASFSKPLPDTSAVCKALVERVRKNRVLVAEGSQVECSPEDTLELGDERLERAIGFLVTAKDQGTLKLGWVGLQTGEGIVSYGPVAQSFTPDEYGLTNDWVIDLQRVDVRPGGAPEVVIRIDEVATAADLALGELALRDRTRVIILALDDGKPLASPELFLSEKSEKKLIDPKSRAVPKGFRHSTDLGKSRAFQMKVAWGAPNTISLTKVSGNGTPPAEGTITLFD